LHVTHSAVETLLFRARRNLAQSMQRTTTRLGSLLNGAVLLRGIRRFLPTAPTKAAAAAATLGLATAATVAPIVGKPPSNRQPAPSHHAAATTLTKSLLSETEHPRPARVHTRVPNAGRGAVELAAPPVRPNVTAPRATRADADGYRDSSPPTTPNAGTTTSSAQASTEQTAPATSDRAHVLRPAASTLDTVVKAAQDAASDVQAAVSNVIAPLPQTPDIENPLQTAAQPPALPGPADVSTVIDVLSGAPLSNNSHLLSSATLQAHP
jgi:hypothetical protein